MSKEVMEKEIAKRLIIALSSILTTTSKEAMEKEIAKRRIIALSSMLTTTISEKPSPDCKAYYCYRSTESHIKRLFN
jgi:hypothetical protein